MRHEDRAATGLFVAPGAARAAYSIGAVRGLLASGVRFDAIGASSVGALIGVFAAMGELDRLADAWGAWRSRDVLRPDWKALLRRPRKAPALMRYVAYESLVTPDVVREEKLLPGLRFRINLANLQTGGEEVFEWPGADIPLHVAVRASVAVPVVVPPVTALGAQWVDGLTVDGFPLQKTLLDTGVRRAFVVGVASRNQPRRRYANARRVATRAAEVNQLTETLRGLDDALARTSAPGGPEIVEILPRRNVDLFFGTYDPAKTRALIDQGHRDAIRRARNL